MTAEVHGFVADGFSRVADALAWSVAEGGEIGCATAAYVDGEKVVDIWCGTADPATDTAWSADTLAVTYSCTKGMTALCAQLLVDRGLLDIDAPVTRYWPEFAAEGKGDALVRHILNHSVGVLTFPRYWDLIQPDGHGMEQSEEIEARIAAAPPAWKPGTAAGYHALTYGWLVGALVRRIDGRSIGRFFADEVAGPLGLELWIGLPPELHDRVAPVLHGDPIGDAAAVAEYKAVVDKARAEILGGSFASIEAQWIGSFLMPPQVEDANDFLLDIMNTPWVRSAEVPGGNGIGTADSLARMYAPLALGGSHGGVDLVSKESIDLFNTRQPLPDGTPTGYCLGYAFFSDEVLALGPSENAFGHAGAGGALGFADPDRRLSFGVVKNRLQPAPTTAHRLVRALYESLAKGP